MGLTLVLFEIDGTLLWTGGAGRAALKQALEQVYGTAGKLDAIDPGGRTIKEIMSLALVGTGITPDTVEQHRSEFDRTMTGIFERLLTDSDYHVEACPGGVALVTALQARPDVLLGLLTGNPRQTADLKLRAAGYPLDAFSVGAYGDESEDRVALLQGAIRRAERQVSSQASARVLPAIRRVVVVGDTVRDVTCGQAVEARTIAVATGGDTRTQLAAAQPSALFENFSDTDAVLSAICQAG